MSACRICGNVEENRTHAVREMMFGTRDSFEYVECGRCGCLQIAEYPKDLGTYYPSDYWDFQKRRMPAVHPGKGFRHWVSQRRTRYWLTDKKDWLGRILAWHTPIPRHVSWLRRGGIRDMDISVLDVGCGLGDRLLALRGAGLSRLEGVDPFIAEDVTYPNGVRVFRKSVFDVQGQYDLITLHHSFEHMQEPVAVLEKLRSLVAPEGVVLLRIPVAAAAWKEYGVHWVQIDAPRHLYLHTVESLGIAAQKAGLTVERVHFDSTAFQFWGSEQYRQDIMLYEPRSYEYGLARSIFTADQIADFARKSRELNKEGIGDQACFYLRNDLFSP